MTSIVTWNVNSVRSRLAHVIDFLNTVKPDILCLQELKVETDKFPYLELEDLGYQLAVHGQKTITVSPFFLNIHSMTLSPPCLVTKMMNKLAISKPSPLPRMARFALHPSMFPMEMR